MAVLILAKHDNVHLNDATAKTVTAAKRMAGEISVLVAGQGCAAVASAAAKLDGVAKVIHVEGEAYGLLAERTADQAVGIAALNHDRDCSRVRAHDRAREIRRDGRRTNP